MHRKERREQMQRPEKAHHNASITSIHAQQKHEQPREREREDLRGTEEDEFLLLSGRVERRRKTMDWVETAKASKH